MLNEILKIKNVSSIDKKQQSLINGGTGTCGAYIPSRSGRGTNNFTAESLSVSGDSQVYRGVSYDEAHALIAGIAGARWCCDSCGSAQWY